MRKLLGLTTVMLALGAMDCRAQDWSTPNSLSSAVSDFQSVCLTAAPGFPKDAKAFAGLGYTSPTKDPAIFARERGGFAGIGYAGMEGDPKVSRSPNGCLVYVKGLEAAKVAKLVEAALNARFKLLEPRKIENDHYWIIRDFAPQRYIAFVAPKAEGNYAGHTLIMLTVQAQEAPRSAKTPPAALPPAEGAKLLEELRKMSPDERIAHFASLTFMQCILGAPNYLAIKFDEGVGVEKRTSSVPGENYFYDSSMGTAIIASATTCIVGYPGTNVDAAFANIRGVIQMRDPNPKATAHDNGYRVELKIDGKPHVLEIIRGEVQGQKMVRAILQSKGQ